MGLFSNRVEKSSLKPGDHIYSWRTAYIYSHHGIYIGDNKVIHFTRHGQEVGTGTVLDVLLVSSAPARSHVPCPTCVHVEKGHGVLSSCLNCFLADGGLYRFEYSVNPALFLAKARGGTCTTAVSDEDDVVVHRAKYLLDNGFGCYNVCKNNCEDFAIYCKTGLYALNQSTMGQSGQVASIIGGPLAVLSASLCLVKTNIYGMAANVVWDYCTSRYAADIGMRSGVVKVSVEDLTRRLATGQEEDSQRNLQETVLLGKQFEKAIEENEALEYVETGRLYVGNLPFTVTPTQLSEIFAEAGHVVSVEVIYGRVPGRSRGFAFVTMGSVKEAEEAIRLFDGAQIGGRNARVNLPEGPKGGEREATSLKARISNKGFVDSPQKGGEREAMSLKARISNKGFVDSPQKGGEREATSLKARISNKDFVDSPQKGGEREATSLKARISNKGFVDSPHKLYAGNLSWSLTSQALGETFAQQPGFICAKVIFERVTGRSRGFGFVTFSSAEQVESALGAMNGVEVEGRPLNLQFAAQRTS